MATQNSLSYPPRTATINRDTKETQVQIKLCIDGGQLEDIPTVEWSERTNKHAFQESPSQYIDIDTGIGFLDHMLHASGSGVKATYTSTTTTARKTYSSHLATPSTKL
jgi:imidazoleglycerol phosphate dehydratase HisB